ncbi:MAG: hypothetical protein ABSD21_12760 [Rhizomicrobium sp.]|jgi:DNA-binding transcriptional LysR family regulator
MATADWPTRYGLPSRNNLENHLFIDTEYYSSQTETWQSWRKAVDRGTIAHNCDNAFAYALLVKAAQGIGLLGNFTLCDPDGVPLDIDVHVRLPIHIVALSDRLQSRPVRLVYDWLSEVFSSENSWFASELAVTFPLNLFSDTFAKVQVGTSLADKRNLK